MDLKDQAANTVILVTNDGMGQADDELRHKLLKIYLGLLVDAELLPAVICFYAAGVKMTLAGSPVLDELKALENAGVSIVLCGTCLDYFKVTDQVAVGIVGGMTDITEAQFRAEKVITI